jgi:hypothetical protein
MQRTLPLLHAWSPRVMSRPRNVDVATSIKHSSYPMQHIMDSLTPDDVDNTDKPDRPAALLSVDVDDDAQREQADRIMSRFGGQDA